MLRPGTEQGRANPRINPVSIRVELDAGVPLAAVESRYHRVHVQEPSPSRREIAQRLGVSEKTVEKQLTQGVRALADILYGESTDIGSKS